VDRQLAAKPRLTRAESKENTHSVLLEAAQEAFTRFGYQGATVDRIAAAAGFTKGAVYAHFRNKEALFLELLADGMKRNIQDTEELLTLLAAKPERLDEELGAWLDQFDASNKVPLLALEMDLESRRDASFAVQLEQVVGQQQSTVSLLLTRYFEIVDRDPPIPIDELATTIIALSRGVALARQTRHSTALTSAKVARILLGMPVPR